MVAEGAALVVRGCPRSESEIERALGTARSIAREGGGRLTVVLEGASFLECVDLIRALYERLAEATVVVEVGGASTPKDGRGALELSFNGSGER
ncbi:MAG: hypothetical protein QXU97_03955 [Fervidicoccaceae archaeon]